MVGRLRYMGLVVLAIIPALVGAQGGALLPPDDPTQSVTYWKPHTIAPERDALAARAHAVFRILLRAWDGPRLEPSLYVVESSAGPWAASLADGNILLSRAAIETCLDFGAQRGDHLLAFVLAHELAHQHADDLWHQRFFRLIGTAVPSAKREMLRGLQVDQDYIAALERNEAQADHDGLIMMASVGYDPYQIVDRQDFFTDWVESIWKDSCASSRNADAARACSQARSRALRTRAQLSNVAAQATLYELGLQAFVAGRYEEARGHFVAYGREYPSRAVFSALGATHLAQALELEKLLIAGGTWRRPQFFYPLLVDATTQAEPPRAGSKPATTRSPSATEAQRNIALLTDHATSAIELFEKAIRLEPAHRKTYLLQAMAYLVQGNTYMARGVLQGKYRPTFGADAASALLLAATTALEGDIADAAASFNEVSQSLGAHAGQSVFPAELVRYTAYYNRAALANYEEDAQRAQAIWRELAQVAQSEGDAFLFRLALAQVNPSRLAPGPSRAPLVRGMRLGDSLTSTGPAHEQSDVWLEGERYRVHRFDDGSRFVVDDSNRVINAWQSEGESVELHDLKVGDGADRPLKVLGMPNRRLDMLSGAYLAYDDYGIAIRIDNERVAGWFLYTSP